MRQTLVTACIVVALLTGMSAALMILRDRQAALAVVEERNNSMASMIAAHADAALDAARNAILSVEPSVAKWDMENDAEGRHLFDELRATIAGMPLLSSAWILDSKGISRLDTWTYPAKPIDGSGRPYFKSHLAGARGAVIMGDDRPGTVTGKQRFTYSQAIRRNDGSIRAVMVVAIYRSNFDALYGEAANWPGATAGLQTMEAAPLARFDPDGAASSPGYLRSLTEHARQYEAGSAIIIAGNEPRLTSWKRSTSHPEVYGSSSQPVEEALRNWKVQAWTVGLLTIAANLAFIAFAIYLHRASQSRQAALANELAVREVNHRVKNSLQLISSLLHMRARKSDDEGYRRATEDVTNHLTALAETYRVVQSATTLESVDINTTLKGLCAHLQQTYDTSVKLEPGTPIMIDAAPATTLAVIVNELVCNGIKHGEGQVTVSCEETQETLRIAVRNSGPPLPEEFSLEEVKGFGLKAVNAMAVGLGGKLSVVSSAEGGAMFEVAVPREALHRKAKAYSI